MTITCPHCGNALECSDDIAEGQHVQCPYCGEKFEYNAKQIQASNQLAKHRTIGLIIKYALPYLSIVCGLIAAYQFLDGWWCLPNFYRSFCPGAIVQGHAAASSATILLCIAKMFAGYIFAKISVFLWNRAK